VIRTAHSHIGGRKDHHTGEYKKVLADDPGPAHAIDASGTREGDPWGHETGVGSHWFYDARPGRGPHAACGGELNVLMDEQFDVERPDACPRCVVLVRAGTAYRTNPMDRPTWCGDYLRVTEDFSEICKLTEGHRGPHRSRTGATWSVGLEDYNPEG
jgi:hypothetical protein